MSPAQSAIVMRKVGGAGVPSVARYAGLSSFTARANSRIFPSSTCIVLSGPQTPISDGPDVLELLLAVQEAAVVELHGRARLPHVAGPERHRHEEGRRRGSSLGRAIRRVVLLHGARELADLPELDVHRALGSPDADLGWAGRTRTPARRAGGGGSRASRPCASAPCRRPRAPSS